MNFKKWLEDFYGKCASNSDTYFTSAAAWNGCKKEVLKIIEDEIDNGKMSIVEAAKKIREL